MGKQVGAPPFDPRGEIAGGASFRPNIVLFGDSITELQVETNVLLNNLGLPWAVLNIGHGGEHVENMLAWHLAEIAAIPNKNTVIVLGGVNNLVVDDTAAFIEGVLQTIYDALHTMGVKVVAQTILPFKNYINWTAGRQVVADAVNAWIMATALNVDTRMDLFSVFEDPANPDELLPAYDSGDGLHPNLAGYDRLQLEDFNLIPWAL